MEKPNFRYVMVAGLSTAALSVGVAEAHNPDTPEKLTIPSQGEVRHNIDRVPPTEQPTSTDECVDEGLKQITIGGGEYVGKKLNKFETSVKLQELAGCAGERTVRMWQESEYRPGKFKRNSGVLRLVGNASLEGTSVTFKTKAPYTCEKGRGTRRVGTVTQITYKTEDGKKSGVTIKKRSEEGSGC